MITASAPGSNSPKPSSLIEGTKVEVQDLFFATPARLKFLKSERSEVNHVLDVVKRLAMANPMIGFTLNNDLKTRFRVVADQLNFLAKSLKPLPEKWHGLSDVEIRYRQRYLDLLVNSKIREIFVSRSRIVSEIRQFLGQKGRY